MWRHELQGQYDGRGCRRLPLDGGNAGSHIGTLGFLAGVEAGGFTSPYPPVMPQDDRGRGAHHPSVDPGGVAHGHHGCLWATLPGSISALSFIPLVTPLRRDDQGLLSDEASGFTSCAACDRHFLVPNGSWGHSHGALRTTALTVGPFVGQGCERSELPCLACGGDI